MAIRKLSEIEADVKSKPSGSRIPALDFLGGAGNTIDKTFIKPLNRLFGSKLPMTGDPEASETMAGKIGETGLDLGLMAATPMGEYKVLAPALTGTVQHQIQNYGQSGEVNPGMAAIEMGLSTAIPGFGKLIQKGAKGAANNVMRWAVQPTAKMKNPNLEPAMESAKGFGKYLESLTGLKDRVTGKVSEAGAAKAAALEDAGFIGRRGKGMIDAVKDIDSRRPEMGPTKGLNAPEREEAVAGVNRWAEPKSNLTPKETMSFLSKVYDDAYKSGKDVNLAGRERGARELGRQMRGQMDSHMQKANPIDLARYESASKDYRTFEPIRQAVNHRVETPPVRKPMLSRIPLVGDVLDPLIYRPGTANALYDIGRPSKATKAGRRVLDLGRSAIFSPKGE